MNVLGKVISQTEAQITWHHFLGQPSLAMDLWEENRSLKQDSSQRPDGSKMRAVGTLSLKKSDLLTLTLC